MDTIKALEIPNLVARLTGLSFYNLYGISSVASICYFLGWLLFYFMIYLNFYYQLSSSDVYIHFIHLMIQYVIHILKFLTGTSLIVTKLTNKCKFIQLFKTITSTSHRAQQAGFVQKGTKSQATIFFILTGYLCMFIYRMLVSRPGYVFSTFQDLMQKHYCHMLLIELFSFIVILQHLFKGLNLELEKIGQIQRNITDQEVVSQLKAVVEVHITLRRLTEEVNAMFVVPLTMSLFIFLLTFSTDVYITIEFLLWTSHILLPNHDILLYFSLNFISLLLLCNFCHTTTFEANRAVELVHHLHQEDSSPVLLQEIETFSMGVSGNRVQFSAGGMFVIDRTLLTKIAITTISYMIISLQLGAIKWERMFSTEASSGQTTNILLDNITLSKK